MSSEEDTYDGGLPAHRIPITILSTLLGFCFIAGSAALVFQKNTFIAKRKAFQYMVLATIGLVFYLRDTLDIVWTYPAYNDHAYVTYLYYLVAVPVHYIPVMVRSWRIYCVYRTTPNWKCVMEKFTTKRRRGHQWMLTRIFVLYIPWAITSIGSNWDANIAYYTFVGINGVYAIGNLVMTYKLYTMRDELRQKYLDETKSLLSYAIIALIEWVWMNTLYMIAFLQGDQHGVMVVLLYGELVWIALMWGLTTGKTLFRVWAKRDLEGDVKPALAASDIQKALQRAESGKSGVSIDMSTTSETESESVSMGDAHKA